MVEQHILRQLKSMLESVRHQIKLLETSDAVREEDKELRKRLRKAKSEESAIVAELSKMDLNE